MNLGMGEIGLLIVLALVLFGAKRLPEVGRAAGEAIREFKSAMNVDSRRGGSGERANSADQTNPVNQAKDAGDDHPEG
jgi:sec-independent protein translocase protein TatA